MKILRKLVLITVFSGLLIYGAYLVKCRLGIDVDEYHHAGDYVSAIARPQQFAAAAKSPPQTELTPLETRETPSATDKITVDLTKENGTVNPKVYGSNLLGHEGAKAADYGYGLWDGKWGGVLEEPLRLAKEAGITMARFPGVDATNEQKHDNVKVTEKAFEIKGSPFEFTFDPRSLTAIEITR